jgi:hypothetical protein
MSYICEILPPRQHWGHDTRRCSAMPALTYVPQLFNAAQYQASLHTLRWKDRPLGGVPLHGGEI